MTAAKPALRCAIYTRKSSEEGLEQQFNSLDAQREACEAYIRSQAGEGWRLIRSRYDDGGFSGGTMERPGLQRLLADIRERKVDILLVYKVDRLTRSLADFAKIVEVLDAQGVSFVSVTQQFNTTTSMGRLTLNMLLSFAQFEREVTGERIRDKIAASKQKGLWMGGFVPLGYEPHGRTLSVNEAEAVTVRTLFRLYLELGTVRQVKEAADRLGLTTKIRKGAHLRGGRPLSRGHIYKLLSNPLYIGRIAHRGKLYDGQHAAIVDAETWERVQTALAVHTSDRSSRARASDPSPLMGKLFDETGAVLTPTHAVKSGRRYRYYVSRHLIARSGTSDAETQGWRLPAGEIERILREAVANLLADHASLTHAARESDIAIARIPGLIESAARWRGEGLDLVTRVQLSPDEIAIVLDLGLVTGETGMMVRHLAPASMRRRGVEMRLVLEGEGDARPSRPDPALIKAVARARSWFDDLVSGRSRSFAELAKAEGCSERYVSRLMPLAFLAPEIVEAVLAGAQPIDLTTETLTRRADLPLGWADQKASLGFGP